MNQTKTELQRFGRLVAMLWGLGCILSTPGLQSRVLAGHVRGQLHKSFKQWSQRWDEQAVQEFIEDIVELTYRRTNGLSDIQLQDISAGLSNLDGVRPVIDVTHPIEKELRRQSMLYWIDTYLTLGPGDQKQRQALKNQLDPFFKKCREDLIDRYPQLERLVTNATRQACNHINNNTIDNNLRRDYKRPVDEQVIDELFSSWSNVLSKLPREFAVYPDPVVTEKMMASRFFRAIQQALVVVRDNSMIETLPKPKQLIDAEQNLWSSYSDIRKWRSAKIEEQFHKRMEETRLKLFRRVMGVDDQSLIDYIEQDVPVETSFPEADKLSEPNDDSWTLESDAHKNGLTREQNQVQGIGEPNIANDDEPNQNRLMSGNSSGYTSYVKPVLSIIALILMMVGVCTFRLRSSCGKRKHI